MEFVKGFVAKHLDWYGHQEATEPPMLKVDVPIALEGLDPQF